MPSHSVHACKDSCCAVHQKRACTKNQGETEGVGDTEHKNVMQACFKCKLLVSFNFASTAVWVENEKTLHVYNGGQRKV